MEIKRSKEEAVECKFLRYGYLATTGSVGACELCCTNKHKLDAIKKVCVSELDKEFQGKLTEYKQSVLSKKLVDIGEAFKEKMRIDNIIICQMCEYWLGVKTIKPEGPRDSSGIMSGDYA